MLLKVGRGAMIYKRDLQKAYRQFPVDPGDYRFLRDELYFDTFLLMGQCNAGHTSSLRKNKEIPEGRKISSLVHI